MLTIKTPTNLRQLSSNHHLYAPAKPLMERLIISYDHPEKPYSPDEEGFIVICEDGDQDGPLKSIWPDEPNPLADHPWEGGGYETSLLQMELDQESRRRHTLTLGNGGSSRC